MPISNVTIPAPVGGLNTKNNPVTMEQSDAVVMQDVVIEGGCVRRRDGFVAKSERLGFSLQGNLESFDLLPIELAPDNRQVLMRLGTWDDGSQMRSGGIVYGDDGFVTCTQSMITSFRADYIKFAGQQIYVFDGNQDVPHYYKHNNGTFADTLIPCNLTHEDASDNFDPMKLFKVESHGKRLFFLEEGTMRLWYIDQVGAFQGNMEYIDVSYLSKQGTKLIELAEWTRTGADTINTMLVAFSDEGEAFVWSGTDPESADWVLSGTYYIPPLMGTHSVVKVGADLLVMTEKGLYSADAFTAQSGQSKLVSFSDKIERTVKNVVEDARVTGKQGSLYFSNDRKEVWWLWGREKTPYQRIKSWRGTPDLGHALIDTEIYSGEQFFSEAIFPELSNNRIVSIGGHFVNFAVKDYPADSLTLPGSISLCIGYKNKQGQFVPIYEDTVPNTKVGTTTTFQMYGVWREGIPLGDWDGKFYCWVKMHPENNTLKEGSAVRLWFKNDIGESNLDITYVQYSSRRVNRIEDGQEFDRQALVYSMNTETWSVFGDSALYPVMGAYIFSNLKGLCDFKGQMYGAFSLKADGSPVTGMDSCIAALEEGGIEFNNKMTFAIHQAASDLGSQNVKKVSYIILNAIVPYEDVDIAVTFYADFEAQSIVRVPVSGYKLDPKTGKIPPQQIHVDCPCSPCTYFAIRLDVTSSTEVPHMFEWISTQVFFKEGVI